MIIKDRPTKLRVDLDALLNNYNKLNSLNIEKIGLAVVKADSYGLGAKVIARHLYENGVRHFATATLEEALELKDIIKDSMILVLGVINPLNVKYAVENNISLTCPSREWLEDALLQIQGFDKKLKIHVKIDTGMGRIGASELEELEIGHCCRETYFRFKNSYQDNVTSKVTEDIEKNMLSKEQFLRKVKLVDIYKEPENTVVNTFGLNIETTEDGFIYDYERDKEYILLIKPVNDSVGIIKNKVWNKFNAKPLSYHIPEIMLNMFLIRKPLKLIYVGKNNSELYKEFNFGFQDSCLSIDNNKIDEYNLSYLLDKIKLFEKHIEKDVVPRKIFTDKSLGMDEINNMQSYGLIEDFEINKLLNGEMYKNFQCNGCKYKTICENC